MIKKQLYFHWLFDTLPVFSDRVMSGWKQMYPDWSISLITEIPSSFPASLKPYLLNTGIPAAFRGDLFRYWAMWKYGGVYVDFDTLPIERIPDAYLNRRLFMGDVATAGRYQSSEIIPYPCFIGSCERHEFWEAVLDNCLHPERWPFPEGWFCSSNVFPSMEENPQLIVDIMPHSVIDATPEETAAFLKDSNAAPLPTGNGYLKHYLVSRSRNNSFSRTIRRGQCTWRTVCGKYPCEINASIPDLTPPSRRRIVYGEAKNILY